ncbi:MAG: hypothetical protein Q8914_01495 [Bacteroidota bacterium]|nr:hypothetical protein [Bacteroidota bacterium]
MRNKRLVCLWLLFFSVTLCLPAQTKVAFFEEHIDFKLDREHFSVNGIYSFRNRTKELVVQRISFPFASEAGTVDSIRVLDLNCLKAVPFMKSGNAIYFELNVQPEDTLAVQIAYRQKALAKNTYILTSTRAWGSPLDRAFYTLTTPDGIPVRSFSYQPDSVRQTAGQLVYFWKKTQFLPAQDFEVVVDKVP